MPVSRVRLALFAALVPALSLAQAVDDTGPGAHAYRGFSWLWVVLVVAAIALFASLVRRRTPRAPVQRPRGPERGGPASPMP